ncbi:hypothetical protein SPBR_09242 [Sporothrix brasiliensis 5110]|uniref:Uncharacterized protein n=1 Tax=Sporothrix brasiliensis 5110 TaxID=1398154 RepID=A0A0C2J7E6_9PEZI|nr:uncharacterized protein SPBR_09242 [Sporothrix brasiliensis 5110]KIH94920.1 hypothetical protein SPBR_09242 [Sporothrix brasiliensis 5110]
MVLSSFSVYWVPPLSTRLRLGRTYFKSLAPNVVRVSRHRIIKGPYYLCELEALLHMELVEGVSLAGLWFKTGLVDDVKTTVMADLHGTVAQIRSLPPPAQQSIVASASASTKEGLSDGRIGPETAGPFASHDAFHTFLRGGIPSCPSSVKEKRMNCDE